MRKLLKQTRLYAVIAGLVLIALVAAACGNNGEEGTPGGGLAGLTPVQVETLAGQLRSQPFTGGLQGTGVHVSGRGQVSTEPDLAVLSLSVDAMAPTVAEARRTAAGAMELVMAVLRDHGVAEWDMQTQHFSIRPEYAFDRTERRLLGYRVTNSLAVKVRDLDDIGTLIDDAAVAGGDTIRVDRIRFTLENGAEPANQARALAVQDALAKANLLARETGVTLGKLQFITETSAPPARVARAEAAPGLAPATTPVSAGEMDITVTVQAVFGIE